MPSKSQKLRELIAAPEILVMPGIYDGFSSRVVARSGFAAGFITGAGVSEASLGWADVGVMSYEENLRVCRAIVGCFDLPTIADADTGYGNAVNVHFTVRGFEQAGVSGISIEDQVWPKRCGHMKGKAVIAADEMAQKIKSAADARRSDAFVMRARTAAAATHGIAEVIDRLCLYAEAGADIVFADALLSAEAIGEVARSVPKPLAVN